MRTSNFLKTENVNCNFLLWIITDDLAENVRMYFSLKIFSHALIKIIKKTGHPALRLAVGRPDKVPIQQNLCPEHPLTYFTYFRTYVQTKNTGNIKLDAPVAEQSAGRAAGARTFCRADRCRAAGGRGSTRGQRW